MNARIFDRTNDVAKFYGCNTRNVEYRWTIFEKYLQRLPKGAAVLDFGAGSLRETHELCALGFDVTAVDNNASKLQSFYADYRWHREPDIVVSTDLIPLKGRKFALVTAFDVFEHLHDPDALLAQMRNLMADDALLFCTVPNRRSVFEITWRIIWKVGLAMGKTFTPGEPHIQFKSPNEWRAFFEANRFRVIEHEMTIGFFVNTWAALVDLPVGIFRRLRRMLGMKVPAVHSTFMAGPKIMSVLYKLDRLTEWKALYGWNLFVLHHG